MPMSEKSPWIADTTAATFEKDVVQQSLERPVVVDFWATWCQPCQLLAPTLEKLATEYGGKFALIKVNVDEQQEIAAAFGVESIPYVVAVAEGRPVAEFTGVKTEPQLREWLAEFLPAPADELLRKGQQQEEAGEFSAAEASYREALQHDEKRDDLRISLARTIVAQDRDEEAATIIEQLEKRGWLEPEGERVKSQLELRAAAAETGGLDEARKAVAANPDDLMSRIRLADALAVARKHQEALEICLQVVLADRGAAREEAKQTMVRIFDMLGSASELTSSYRRKLSTALY